MSMKATAAKKRAPKARTMLAMKAVAESRAGTRGATAKALAAATVSTNGKYTVGKCSALGSGCTLENLQNNRHFCADCGDGVHAIAPCGREVAGKLYCYPCFQDNVDKENELHLNTGNCPAMSEQCMTYDEGFGGVHCYFCQLPVHDKPTCCALDAKGDVWCKSCARRERDDEFIAIAKKDKDIDLDADPSLLTSILGSDSADSPMAEPLPPLLGQPSPEEEEDEDPKKNAAGRGKSYSEYEDFLIAKAWAAVSEDSRNGVGNKAEVFHDRLKQFAHTLVSEHNEDATTIDSNLGLIPIRNGKSIFYRWNNVIKPACSKWSGICKLIKIKSGEDFDVVTSKRQEMYRHAHGKGKDFPHLEAYGLIEDLPKWKLMVDGKESGTAKTKAAKKAARKEKQVAKAKRSIGKRQKALNDKILKINSSLGNNPPTTTNSGGACDAIAMFTQQLGGMATQFSMNEWNSEDRIAYLRNQAQIKFLEQEKQMMLLRAEVRAIQEQEKAPAGAAVAAGHGEEGSDDSDDDE